MGDARHDVTELLQRLQAGSEDVYDQLIPILYGELRSLASSYLRGERPDHTLQPTALVHEAFLKLVDQRSTTWQNRAHFFGIAAQAMRRILVDHARRHRAEKRGAGRGITLEDHMMLTEAPDVDVLLVDSALDRLAALDARQARVVELRFFAGLGNEEVAEVLGISLATVKRDWILAKAWLQRELDGSPEDPANG
ncbi:MAG: sigma-70 family RNA polymerase sigma factor [Gemmatimonadota bacterium]